MITTANCTIVINGLDVIFTDTSISNSGPIIGGNWSFGDGTGASGINATHTYATAGEYIIYHAPSDGTPGGLFILKTLTVGVVGVEAPLADLIKAKVSQLLYDTYATVFIPKWQYYLQNQTEPVMEDADVLDETKWPYLWNVLIAELVVYEIMMAEASKWMSSGNTLFVLGSGNSSQKSIETGPSKAEWWDNQKNQNEYFKILFTQGLAQYRELLCQFAQRVRASIPFCNFKRDPHLNKKAGRKPDNSGSIYNSIPTWLT